MSRRATFAIISAAGFAVAAGCLVSGAAWLPVPLAEPVPIPAGNLVAAVLYISLAALTVAATRPGNLARAVGWLLLAAAVLWLPLSTWLAGNLELNFARSAWRSELWMFYTYKALPGGCLLLLLWQLIRRAIERLKRPGVKPSSAAGAH